MYLLGGKDLFMNIGNAPTTWGDTHRVGAIYDDGVDVQWGESSTKEFLDWKGNTWAQVVTEKGKIEITFKVYDVSPETLQRFVGGTSNSGSWSITEFPDGFTAALALDVPATEGETGMRFIWNKCKVIGKVINGAKREDPMMLEIKATVLKPESGNIMEITEIR